MPAFSRAEYEKSLYSLTEQYPAVSSSTLRLYTHSATTAFVRGSIYFKNGLELRIFEYLDLTDGELLDYSYTVYRGGAKIRWYDPQPHPDDTDLAPTFPHHYHELPDIKHNRRPSHGVGSHVPNLAVLIANCLEIQER
jgi:hypothetical protein